MLSIMCQKVEANGPVRRLLDSTSLWFSSALTAAARPLVVVEGSRLLNALTVADSSTAPMLVPPPLTISPAPPANQFHACVVSTGEICSWLAACTAEEMILVVHRTTLSSLDATPGFRTRKTETSGASVSSVC